MGEKKALRQEVAELRELLKKALDFNEAILKKANYAPTRDDIVGALNVTRYRLSIDGSHQDGAAMVESKSGGYVRLDDYLALANPDRFFKAHPGPVNSVEALAAKASDSVNEMAAALFLSNDHRVVAVTSEGVSFGDCWLSHEKITGLSAEDLNEPKNIIAAGYVNWLSGEDRFKLLKV